eukprot:1148441-Pelagomonas_calceolata.AAC.8
MARLVKGMGSTDSPTHTQEDCVESDLCTLQLFAVQTLHSSLCCCREASSWAPGLVSSQYMISIKWIWRFWVFTSWSCLAGVVLLLLLHYVSYCEVPDVRGSRWTRLHALIY